jgi:hypothetical protein
LVHEPKGETAGRAPCLDDLARPTWVNCRPRKPPYQYTPPAADAPRFGQPITQADIAPWDISIVPDGGPAILQSRATDEAGNVQPSREQFIADRVSSDGSRSRSEISADL